MQAYSHSFMHAYIHDTYIDAVIHLCMHAYIHMYVSIVCPINQIDKVYMLYDISEAHPYKRKLFSVLHRAIDTWEDSMPTVTKCIKPNSNG